MANLAQTLAKIPCGGLLIVSGIFATDVSGGLDTIALGKGSDGRHDFRPGFSSVLFQTD